MTAPEHGARWSGQWQDDQIAKASRDNFVMPPPIETVQSRLMRYADLAARIVLVTALTTWAVGTIIKVVFQ